MLSFHCLTLTSLKFCDFSQEHSLLLKNSILKIVTFSCLKSLVSLDQKYFLSSSFWFGFQDSDDLSHPLSGVSSSVQGLLGTQTQIRYCGKTAKNDTTSLFCFLSQLGSVSLLTTHMVATDYSYYFFGIAAHCGEALRYSAHFPVHADLQCTHKLSSPGEPQAVCMEAWSPEGSHQGNPPRPQARSLKAPQQCCTHCRGWWLQSAQLRSRSQEPSFPPASVT